MTKNVNKLTKHQAAARERLRSVLANYDLLDPIHGLGQDVDEAVRRALGALADHTPATPAALSPEAAPPAPADLVAQPRDLRAAITPRDIETLIAELWTVKSGPWVLTRYQMRSLAGHAAVALAHQHAEIADLTAKLAEAEGLDRAAPRETGEPR